MPRAENNDASVNRAALAVQHKQHLQTISQVIVGLLVLVTALGRDAYLLFRYAVPTGLDGYYYVNVIQHYAATTPLVPHGILPTAFFAVLARVCHDPVVGIKVAVLTLMGALLAGLWVTVQCLTHSSAFATLSVVVAGLSNLHTYFVTEFLNNLFAVALMVVGVGLCAVALRRRSVVLGCVGIVCLVAGAASHKSVLLVSVVMAVGVASGHLCGKWKRSRWFVLAAPTVLIWTATVVIAVTLAARLPFGSELTAVPSWPVAGVGWPDKTILLITVPIVLSILHKALANRSVPLALMAGFVTWACGLTLNPFLKHGLGSVTATGRLDDLAFIQTAVLLPCCLHCMYQHQRKLMTTLLVPVGLLVLCTVAEGLPLGARAGYLAARERLVHELMSVKPSLPPMSLVIAPHGEQYVVTAVLGIPAQHQLVPARAPQAGVYWLVHDIAMPLPSTASFVLLENTSFTATVLIADPSLRAELRKMNVQDRISLLRKNPPLIDLVNEIGSQQ
jgi:hypothetical protein